MADSDPQHRERLPSAVHDLALRLPTRILRPERFKDHVRELFCRSDKQRRRAALQVPIEER